MPAPMSNSLLYVLTVLIWGSTWIAIKYQLGEVWPMVSIGHRFMLAAGVLFIFLLLRRRLQPLTGGDHLRIFAQGLTLFCINYVFIYTATADLASGLVAVVFSTMVFFNIVNGALFLGLPASPVVAIGGLVGIVGMVGVFLPELSSVSFDDRSARALVFCLLGTCSASLGNILAVSNQRRGLEVLTSNAWGMLYGALTLYAAALLAGQPLAMDWRISYLASLAYLSVVGSVVAFWAYVTLIGRIGADRASYTSLLFPLVALLLSTLLEGYTWTWQAVAGLCLVLMGNWIAMRRGTR
jgi:drug/metabolite transporter (DMT)-like permease